MAAVSALKRLKQTLAQRLPYCGGTFELPSDSFELYYGKENAKFVNLSKAATNRAALDYLQSACQPAQFGRNTETVLDETYRKAGKMDTSEFLMRLDVTKSGLLDVVNSSLLSGDKSRRSVTAELYKLNVYGEGAFFKSHTDTPTNSNMFGSLVVVFPTPHSGGTLVLRHHEHEWTFDSAKLLSGTSNRLAYAAFFSDVEHEVTQVTSGHRITVTYNLYWAGSLQLDNIVINPQPDGVTVLQPPSANATDVGRVLSEVLEDESLLPAGGTLGFGLRHAYPIPRTWDPDVDKVDPLLILPALLKGSDLALFDACEALGLQPELKFISEKDTMDYDDKPVLVDQAVQLGDMEVRDPEDVMLREYNGVAVEEVGPDFKPSEKDLDKTVRPVYWVTDVGKINKLASTYIHYGNEGVLSHLYMTPCLTVEVGPVGARQVSRTK